MHSTSGTSKQIVVLFIYFVYFAFRSNPTLHNSSHFVGFVVCCAVALDEMQNGEFHFDYGQIVLSTFNGRTLLGLFDIESFAQ